MSHSLSSNSLKRRATSPLEDSPVEGRKRLKEDTSDEQLQGGISQESQFLDEMGEELQCGCCSALVYRPVIVMPCQHFFCGRYVNPLRFTVDMRIQYVELT
jgi:E3 ubiquitin-protein ligase CHFR